MIDLTLNEYDKDTFITDILLSKEYDKFIVKYADGSSIIEDFNISSFNSFLSRMEKQFYMYKDEFVASMKKKKFNEFRNIIASIVIELVALGFTVYGDLPNILKTIFCIAIAMISFGYQFFVDSKIYQVNFKLNIVKLSEELLKYKKDFSVRIKDPSDNKYKDWYIVNLANIDVLFEVEHFEQIDAYFTPEVKNDYQLKLTKKFNKES